MITYDGDPKLYLRQNGSFLIFKSAQPDMDEGIWNATFISLNTRENWAGNTLFDNDTDKYGSDFEKRTEQNISIAVLNQIQNAAIRAMKWMIDEGLVDSTSVTVVNPSGHNLEVIITHIKNGVEVFKAVLLKNGVNWIAQEIA